MYKIIKHEYYDRSIWYTIHKRTWLFFWYQRADYNKWVFNTMFPKLFSTQIEAEKEIEKIKNTSKPTKTKYKKTKIKCIK